MQDELSRELTLRLQALLQAAQTDSQAVTNASSGSKAALTQAAANFEQLIDAIQSTLQNVLEAAAETPETNNHLRPGDTSEE